MRVCECVWLCLKWDTFVAWEPYESVSSCFICSGRWIWPTSHSHKFPPGLAHWANHNRLSNMEQVWFNDGQRSATEAFSWTTKTAAADVGWSVESANRDAIKQTGWCIFSRRTKKCIKVGRLFTFFCHSTTDDISLFGCRCIQLRPQAFWSVTVDNASWKSKMNGKDPD